MGSEGEAATAEEIAALGTILGVWAHPDDECYLMSGVTILARTAGNTVACVTATQGELGTPDPQTWPPQRLARLRRWELRAALSILDVNEHHWLGYPDGGCRDIDPQEAVEAIGALITSIRPDTIMTFGPDGMTGHADHISICEWTTAARARYAPESRLLYAATTPEALSLFGDKLEGFNVWQPGYPILTERSDLALRLDLDGEALDQKFAALRAQASQTAILVHAVGEESYRDLLREEAFRDADGH